MKKILFASFESMPFIKVGGLADVVYALPKALDKNKFEVKVVLPLHQKIKEKYYTSLNYLDHIYINSGFIKEEANVYKYINEGIEYLFIENDTFFNRPNIYGYRDDPARFSFYNVAILEMLIKLDYYPDIIHSHDYHTGVLGALCKCRYNGLEKIRNIKHIFTIHNLAYQGEYDKQVLFDLLGFDYKYWLDGSLKYEDYCNFMKIGIHFADKVTTVSESYAKEIQTAEFGEGLDSILRMRNKDLVGIVNGIDTDLFNPNTDSNIVNYNQKNYLKGKKANKENLQKELGLEINPDKMLVGMISRLTWQKGLDIFKESFDWMLQNDNIQIAILGSGEERFESYFQMMEYNNKGKVVFYKGYNETLANRMYAGLDLLLMPSLFEPCGISQLIAMRYGTLPLVRECGGLKDTVLPYNKYTKQGRGFSFNAYDGHAFRTVFDYAFKTYYEDKKSWNKLMINAMNYDVSFAVSSLKYEKLYLEV